MTLARAGARRTPAGTPSDCRTTNLRSTTRSTSTTAAVQLPGEETLRGIARELAETVRGKVTIDWTLRENVRANLHRLVKRDLRKHGYPPDRQESATRTVLEQAEVRSAGWVA